MLVVCIQLTRPCPPIFSCISLQAHSLLSGLYKNTHRHVHVDTTSGLLRFEMDFVKINQTHKTPHCCAALVEA